MITDLHIKNFKRLEDTGQILLDSSVVFIGPNNSGKTTALQALSLWYIGLSKWLEKKAGKSKAQIRTAIPINRKDLFAIPTPHSKYLWNNLLVRESERDSAGKLKGTSNVNIEIHVSGINEGKKWKCALEFEYRDEEVLYCRPVQTTSNTILSNPEDLRNIKIAYLPPMSGLVSQEPKLLPATVLFRIGEGRTAEVLRNLCYQILLPETGAANSTEEKRAGWNKVVEQIKNIFGVQLNEPVLNERGEITITYTDEHKNILDLSSSGRGLQQVLLLIAYLFNNPGSALLLDEPDAHLEILRQRQIYNLITDISRSQGSQIIAASHSEVVLNEAVGKDVVIAFIGNKPHRINDKGSQLMKSLETIGFQDYYQAEEKGWILYLEGSTDLSILKTFANKLNHPVATHLDNCFVKYVSTNLPTVARNHFYGIKEAVPNFKAVAVFDNIDKPLKQDTEMHEMMWKRQEIENYIFLPDVLNKYAAGTIEQDLFSSSEQQQRTEAMKNAMNNIIPKIALSSLADTYWTKQKASEQLERIFTEYFKALGLRNMMNKNKFFELAELMGAEQIEQEISDVLDVIYEYAESARKLEGKPTI